MDSLIWAEGVFRSYSSTMRYDCSVVRKKLQRTAPREEKQMARATEPVLEHKGAMAHRSSENVRVVVAMRKSESAVDQRSSCLMIEEDQ